MADIPVYTDLPIAIEPDDLIQDAFDYITTYVPDWIAHEANFEVILLYAFALIAAEAGELANDVPPGAFKWFGATVANIPPVDASPASVASTWTMIDSAGYTIPDGALVSISAAGSNAVLFAVQGDITVPAGSNTTAVGEVILEAMEDGAVGNGLAGTVNLVDALDFVGAITLVGTTSGGVDEETDQDYINRLAIDLSLQTPRPILPNDFALLARNIAGVVRSTAVDGYNPVDQTYNNERMVAVAAIDSAGIAVGSTVKTSIQTYLESMREINFVVNVIDPSSAVIDVSFTGVAQPGWDTTDVSARSSANVIDYLNPAKWGLPTGTGEVPAWLNIPYVRLNNIIQILEDTDGMDYTVNGSVLIGLRKTGTIAAATDTVTLTAHGYANGDQVILRSITGGAGLSAGTTYFVVGATANTFQLATTSGGAAINVTTDATAAVFSKMGTADIAMPGAVPLPVAGTVTGSVALPS